MGQQLGSYCIWVTDMDRVVHFWETLMGLDVQLHTDLGTIKEVVLASNEGGSRPSSSRTTPSATRRSTTATRSGSST